MVYNWEAISAISTVITAVVVLVLGLTRQRQARKQLVYNQSEQAQECARIVTPIYGYR